MFLILKLISFFFLVVGTGEKIIQYILKTTKAYSKCRK